MKFKSILTYSSNVSKYCKGITSKNQQSILSSFTLFLFILLINSCTALPTLIFLIKSYKMLVLFGIIYKLILFLLSPFYPSVNFLYVPLPKLS